MEMLDLSDGVSSSAIAPSLENIERLFEEFSRNDVITQTEFVPMAIQRLDCCKGKRPALVRGPSKSPVISLTLDPVINLVEGVSSYH